MGVEIERKFLVVDDSWRQSAPKSLRMRQGYLSDGTECSVRVRLEDRCGKMNIKSSRDGVRRLEFEYEIPAREAEELLDQVALRPLIEKVRYHVPVGGHLWEIDVFEGDNQDLVVAEIELQSEDEVFERPAWLGREVSDDLRYYNMSLRKNPYKNWKE
ncbi:MAG: CYTH domain-containing protein [Pseudomonadota bacterium]